MLVLECSLYFSDVRECECRLVIQLPKYSNLKVKCDWWMKPFQEISKQERFQHPLANLHHLTKTESEQLS
jgi:hypothetical protein